jgi:KDO2-lipid IV(A) lauroyltransferase
MSLPTPVRQGSKAFSLTKSAEQPVRTGSMEERSSRFGLFARRKAADFWLNLLFWQTRRNPQFPVKTKPIFFLLTWKFAHLMRENTLCNSRRLLGSAASQSDQLSLARSTIGHFYDFICDVGRSVGQSREQMLKRIEATEGHDNYLNARAAGKGAIVVTAHMGSFEVGIAALLEHDKCVHVVFRKDAYGRFERTRSALRQSLGVNEHCVDDGLAVWMRLRDALTNDEVVLVQGDRVMPGQKGKRVAFMGGHMMLPTGPAKLALASGAPIVPIFSVRRDDGQIRLFVEEPIWVKSAEEVDEAITKFAEILEQYLRRFPDQWLMIQRAWCEDMTPVPEGAQANL